MKLLEMMDQSSDFFGLMIKKLSPPLVTLLSAEPETQYVALRNINLIVQKRQGLILFYSHIPSAIRPRKKKGLKKARSRGKRVRENLSMDFCRETIPPQWTS